MSLASPIYQYGLAVLINKVGDDFELKDHGIFGQLVGLNQLRCLFCHHFCDFVTINT